jgi:hypothetical protein
MIRITLLDEMAGDGFSQILDASFVVHALALEDARLFRCDVYGEVLQWDASSDRAALEFIVGLHDMWSRVISPVRTPAEPTSLPRSKSYERAHNRGTIDC